MARSAAPYRRLGEPEQYLQNALALRGLAVWIRGAAHPVHPCVRRDSCRAGMSHLCSTMGLVGMAMPSTFFTYFIFRADRAWTIADLPILAVALAKPVCVCMQAIAILHTRADALMRLHRPQVTPCRV